MLAKTVHVVLGNGQFNGPINLKDKEFYFRIDKKIQEPIEPGMIAFSSDGQLVYILELIEGISAEEEAAYTGVLTKIFAVDPEINTGGKGIKPRKLLPVEKVVYTGIVVELVDRKFKRTEKKMRFRAIEKVYGQISKGDIVPIVLNTRDSRKEKYYVLVHQIFENAGQKLLVMKTKRSTINWFYKKTNKGYKKTRYVPKVIENEENEKIKSEDKSVKQQSEKKRSEVTEREKSLEEADKEFNRAVHSFVIRKRRD